MGGGRTRPGALPSKAAGSESADDSSACSTSAALCGRSAGRFSRQRMRSAASAGGTLGRSSTSGGGRCSMCAATTACAVGAVNGGRPASISYPSTPSA